MSYCLMKGVFPCFIWGYVIIIIIIISLFLSYFSCYDSEYGTPEFIRFLKHFFILYPTPFQTLSLQIV